MLIFNIVMLCLFLFCSVVVVVVVDVFFAIGFVCFVLF